MGSGSVMRPRRWIIGSLVLGLVAAILFWWLGPSELDAHLARLRSAGQPTNAAELNAYYKVPDGVTDSTARWIAAIDGLTAAKVDERGSKLPVVGLCENPIPAPGEDWAELDASRTFLTELQSELQTIRQAAESGGAARFPLDFSAGVHSQQPVTPQQLRSVARLLTLQAHVSAHDDQDDVALKDVLAVLATSDALRAEPLAVSQLVRIALHTAGCHLATRLLPHCEWSDEQLSELQTAMAAAEFRAELLRAVTGERALTVMFLADEPSVFFGTANAIEAIELFDDAAEGIAEGWPSAITAANLLGVQLRARMAGGFSRLKYMPVMTMFPPVGNMINSAARAEARRNCAILTIAAHRYRAQHGEFPKSLSQLDSLQPGDAAERSARLTDPFDGQPLRYVVDGNRLRVYSVGENQIDDGGQLSELVDNKLPDVGVELKY